MTNTKIFNCDSFIYTSILNKRCVGEMRRYKRVFLIKLTYKESYSGAFHLPVGLGYIAESLFQNNIKSEIFDMSLRHLVNMQGPYTFTRDDTSRAVYGMRESRRLRR